MPFYVLQAYAEMIWQGPGSSLMIVAREVLSTLSGFCFLGKCLAVPQDLAAIPLNLHFATLIDLQKSIYPAWRLNFTGQFPGTRLAGSRFCCFWLKYSVLVGGA